MSGIDEALEECQKPPKTIPLGWLVLLIYRWLQRVRRRRHARLPG